MIELGGFIFWGIIFLFLVLEGIGLFNKNQGMCAVVGLVGILAFIFGVSEYPDVNLMWLLLYPVVAVAWCPIYWYLALKRRASEVKILGGKEKALESGKGHRLLYEKAGVIKLRHPPVDEITANSILFPVSIPVFVLDNVIHSSIEFLKTFMDKIRDSLSESI